MSKKMLINAHRGEQLRVAIIDGTDLVDYQVEIAEAGLTRGNIYRGVVANIQPSLNAAFIDIGEEKHGFLSADDVLSKAYQKKPPEGKRPRIDQILERRKPIEVQVTKDGIGQKGPALTTNLALAGRYLVLMPYDGMRAISRKAEGVTAREKIKQRLAKLNLPEGHGVIVRTNGLEQNQTTLNRDLNALLRLWKRVQKESKTGRGPRLLYSDQDLLVQALRDYLDTDIKEVLVDDDAAMEEAKSYMSAFMPRSKTKLIRYQERLPIFTRFGLESQIDRIYDREVPLPSGGSIVIDNTEALTAIDVNSGRATKTANHEESIFNVNQEAAREVARQLRLRDIGGLVVVDFIDMRLRKNQRKLEKVARDAMKSDKARNTVGHISPNGLVEINRQRIKQAIRLRTHRGCPTCRGVGSIPSSEFSGLNILRKIEARAATGSVQSVVVALHPEVAETVQNGYRQQLAELEGEFDIKIEIVGSPHFKHSEERMDWTQRSAGEADDAKAKPKSTTGVKATDLTADPARKKRRSAKSTEEATQGEKEKEKETRSRRRKSRTAAKGEEPAESPEAAAEEGGEEARPRRRRSRGGRRTRKAAPKAEAESKDERPEQEKPARTRRGRGRAEDAKPTQGDEAPKPRTRRGRGRAAAEQPQDEETPARTRRGRGRRPAARKSEVQDSRAQDGQPGKGDDQEREALGSDTGSPTRARRSRSRGRGPRTEAADPPDEQPTPKRGRSRAPRSRSAGAPAYQGDPLPPRGNGEGAGGDEQNWPGFPFSFRPKPLSEAQAAAGNLSPEPEPRPEPERPPEAPPETQDPPREAKTRSRGSSPEEAPEAGGGSAPPAEKPGNWSWWRWRSPEEAPKGDKGSGGEQT